ncbi:acetyl-CoA sensor PanZ family protein [Halomonas sp. ML-15]|uniref:acetyl-CoA sensor PanZ family protein n=1 Tax=Halomonas sp. ML-15 TaxID=2773305 RepID=UPI00174727F2|nr:acetyl-CoA sensor PanZ family protein [Halomonas sp. ML-15]MBD3898470.1 acetyl-CoA sensor PanZ family protein [Halomonas sp. ML-15]
MPVALHRVDHSEWSTDDQTALDLSRIYADAPAERLPAPAEEFIRAHLESGGQFCCACFNGRLLAAVAVEVDAEAWWLAYTCVRKTTRRRGVGSRLLALIGEAAAGERRVLRVASSTLQMGDQLLLTRLGYRASPAGDYFELNPRGSLGGHQ